MRCRLSLGSRLNEVGHGHARNAYPYPSTARWTKSLCGTVPQVEDVREYYGGSLTPYHASSYTKRPSVSTGPTPHKMSSDARPSGCPGGYASSSPGPYSRYLAPPHAGAAPDAPTSATFPDTLHNQHDMTQQQEGPWHVTTPFPAAPTAPRRPPHRHRSGYGQMAGGSQASWRALEAAAEATLADAPRTCTGALRATRPAGPSGTASADEGCGRTATRSWRKGLWGLARGSLSGAAAVGSSLGMAAGLGSRRRLNLAPLYEPPVASADVAGASAGRAFRVPVWHWSFLTLPCTRMSVVVMHAARHHALIARTRIPMHRAAALSPFRWFNLRCLVHPAM